LLTTGGYILRGICFRDKNTLVNKHIGFILRGISVNEKTIG